MNLVYEPIPNADKAGGVKPENSVDVVNLSPLSMAVCAAPPNLQQFVQEAHEVCQHAFLLIPKVESRM